MWKFCGNWTFRVLIFFIHILGSTNHILQQHFKSVSSFYSFLFKRQNTYLHLFYVLLDTITQTLQWMTFVGSTLCINSAGKMGEETCLFWCVTCICYKIYFTKRGWVSMSLWMWIYSIYRLFNSYIYYKDQAFLRK